MVISQKLTALVIGTTSIIGLQLLTSLTLSLDFDTAIAQSSRRPFRYVPPTNGNPRSPQGTGSRGCEQSTPISLSLLVPTDHTGQTVSGHPSFFWQLSESILLPIQFTLVEPGVAKPLFEKTIDSPKAGITKVELSKDLPELVIGKQYRWSVTIICNPNRPSTNIFAQSWIERVTAIPELTQKLTKVTTERDRAQVYAESGYWYDALAAISTAYQENPNERSLLEDQLLLLEQAKLDQVVEQERQRLIRQ